MILPKQSDAPHKYQMFRLLTAILSETQLATELIFKGGTCASLRGWLNRFSVDLDFDLPNKKMSGQFRHKFHILFNRLGFKIKDESHKYLQFFLQYPSKIGLRNTLKLEINDDVSPHNESEIANLNEINLSCRSQTQKTMVSMKMVAALKRYQDHRTIAGRDFYDLHYFFKQGYGFKKEIIEERIGMATADYLNKLEKFIIEKVTDKLLFEDLNPLLPAVDLKGSVKNLKKELLWMLRGLQTF